MNKEQRQAALQELIELESMGNQKQLIRSLSLKGIECNQSSISRDLSELGVIKAGGFYRLPSLQKEELRWLEFLQIKRAGEHMLVLKTAAGQASIVALQIDKGKSQGIVGTIAGDDTIFVALSGVVEQGEIIKQLHYMFRNKS